MNRLLHMLVVEGDMTRHFDDRPLPRSPTWNAWLRDLEFEALKIADQWMLVDWPASDWPRVLS